MLEESSSKKAVEVLSSLNDELKSAVIVAEASTKALTRSVLIGTIPLIEFGLIIGFSILIAQVPLKLIGRLNNG
jgi:hypothetical protein